MSADAGVVTGATTNGATSTTTTPVTAAPKVKNGSSGTQTPNPAITTPTTPPAQGEPKATPPPQKFKAKIRGQEREWSPEELIAHASKNVAAEEAMREAATIRKQAEEERKKWTEREARLKSKDVWDELKTFGHDPDAIAKKYILDKYGEHAQEPAPELPPEVKERLAKLEALERGEKERTEKEERQREEDTKLRTRESYRERFVAGLVSLNIPEESPLVSPLIRRMAWHQEVAENGGYELPPEALAKEALADFRGETSAAWSGLEGDALLEEMGQDVVDRVVRASVARIERKRAEKAAGLTPQAPKVTRTDAPPRGQDGKFQTREERHFDSFFRG
jgi:hypothetical protein